MKKVVIYIIVDYREGRPSPWEALLRYGRHEKTLSGIHKARSTGGVSAIALREAIGCLKCPCHVDVYAEPEGFRDLVLSDSPPAMLEPLIHGVSQFIWLRPNDLTPPATSMRDRLQSR